MRWPRVGAALAARGWRVHHLARALGRRPAAVHAWLFGRGEMPPELRRQAERLLGLAAGELDPRPAAGRPDPKNLS
jgi:hypothetical protein